MAPGEGFVFYAVGGLDSGALHLASSLLTYRGSPRHTTGLRLRAGGTYLGTTFFLAVVSILTLGDIIPAGLWAPGSLAQQVAATATAFLLTISAVLFSRVYLRSHNPILYWYSLALWATAIGFLAFFGTNGIGDPLLWTGIGSICVGSVYFLLSVHAVPKLLGAGEGLLKGDV